MSARPSSPPYGRGCHPRTDLTDDDEIANGRPITQHGPFLVLTWKDGMERARASSVGTFAARPTIVATAMFLREYARALAPTEQRVLAAPLPATKGRGGTSDRGRPLAERARASRVSPVRRAVTARLKASARNDTYPNDDGPPGDGRDLYESRWRARPLRALPTAFYAVWRRTPLLRPLFPGHDL